MNEWISFEERWPLKELKVTVKMGDREEIALLCGKKMLFCDQEKMRKNPPTEPATHWKPGRWLSEKKEEKCEDQIKTCSVQHKIQNQTSKNDPIKTRRKTMNIDAIKCECGKPTYLHIISMENGKVNVVCQRYLYTRGDDGCKGYIQDDKIYWSESAVESGKEEGYGCVAFMNRT